MHPQFATLGGNRYALVATGMRIKTSFFTSSPPDIIRPALLFSETDTSLVSDQILLQVARFQELDDVFDSNFLSNVLIIHGRSPEGSSKLRRGLAGSQPLQDKSWPLDTIYTTQGALIGSHVPSGPYFLCGHVIFQAWKIYVDYFSSFQTAVLPVLGSPYHFRSLDSVGPDGLGLSVAVPSRLYSLGRKDKKKPLAGLRIAIKDNFRLEGVRCSMGCRSFLATYGPDPETADYVKTLIDLGACIVGKTKMTAFASSEKPCDWWDYQCPFNPRGDQHLTPGGSSTGSATATAAYPWLDICIGSDTYGSVREPAAQSGVYGIRCSTGKWGSPNGLYPSSSVFDTVGYFCRSLDMFQAFSRSTLGPYVEEFESFPRAILYPTDFFPSQDEAQQHIVESFILILENFLGVRKTEFSLAGRWADSPPPEAEGKTLAEYMNRAGYNPFYYDGYHEYDYFREDHAKKFGTRVYVSPHMQWKWDLGAEVTKAEREQGLRELQVFRNWVADNVLRGDERCGSNAILVLPVGPGQPVYRDIYIPPKAREGIDALTLGAFLRIPQVVLPIGQSKYKSRISGREESLPIAGSIAGAPGSDLMLIKLVGGALKKAGWPTQVACGRDAFPSNGDSDVKCCN
ncbi:amidase signature domain-containing protein [Nemania abortiva]|nr:amidase signature domain-containing protein [Nemania abortiva]